MESDATYFRRRALEERLAEVKADNPDARRVHRELAARYDELADGIGHQDHEERVGIWV